LPVPVDSAAPVTAQSDWTATPYIETMPPARPRGFSLLAGVVAALLIAGAVGAVIEVHRSHEQGNPVAMINAAPGLTTHGGTAHFTANVAISLGGQAGPSITMSGATNFVNNESEMSISSAGLSSTIRLVSGVEYFQSSVIPLPAGAHWVEILPQDLGLSGTQPGLAGSGDPTQGLQFLGSTVGPPVKVGHGTVEGTSVTHYSVVFDLATLFARVGKAEGSISPTFAKGFEALAGKVDLAHIPGNVWLDSAGRVRQFSYTIAFQTAGQAFSEVETTTFSKFGSSVEVTAPPAGETVPFSAVKNEFAQALSPPGATA
jgi:hypothetical protein